jgi:hypothetical protein
MGRIETVVGKPLFNFVFSPVVIFKLVFLGRAIFFTTLELIRPSRTLSYLPVIGRDLVAYVTFRCARLCLLGPFGVLREIEAVAFRTNDTKNRVAILPSESWSDLSHAIRKAHTGSRDRYFEIQRALPDSAHQV